MTTTTIDDRMIDSEAMARRLYYTTLDLIADTQHDLAMLNLIEETWGDDAIMPKKMLRGRIGALRDRKADRDRYRLRLRERHAELLRDAEIIERMLLDKDDADMKDMAAYFAQRFRDANKTKKA